MYLNDLTKCCKQGAVHNLPNQIFSKISHKFTHDTDKKKKKMELWNVKNYFNQKFIRVQQSLELKLNGFYQIKVLLKTLQFVIDFTCKPIQLDIIYSVFSTCTKDKHVWKMLIQMSKGESHLKTILSRFLAQSQNFDFFEIQYDFFKANCLKNSKLT